MPEAASIVVFIGVIVGAAGGVGCVVAIYKENEDWGFWGIFFDVVLLVAVFRYWRDTWKSFLIMILGWLVAAIGWLLGGTMNSLG